jgi:lipopolysaccharide heptosyltransferase II
LNILLVRLRLVGDVVFTTPAVRALRQRFPDARLVYVVEPGAAPVIADNPHVNEVIVIPHSRGWRRLRDDVAIGRRLRAARFDVAIDFHGGPRSAWLTWATRAPMRVGYDVPGRSWMYTHVVHRARELRPRHSVENQWDLLRVVDPSFSGAPDPAKDRVEMPVTDAARRVVHARLAETGMPAGARLAVLHVSAGNPFRRWPEASFAEVAAGVASGAEHRWVAITAGPSDVAAASRVIEAARRACDAHAASHIVEMEGLSLTELRALIERAAVYIGGDSGPLHIAAASDTPVVGLYGPTLPARSAPWRPPAIPTASLDGGTLPCRPCEQRVCEPGDFRCLTGIHPAAVREAAERLMEMNR